MVKTEMYPIKRKMSLNDLNKRIKSLEKMAKVLQRLYFIKYRYAGDSVEIAAEKVGVTKRVGYTWQKRWNKDGYVGLIPRYSGGRPPKLNEEQRNELEILLNNKVNMSIKDVRDLIEDRFDIHYSLKQTRIIINSFK